MATMKGTEGLRNILSEILERGKSVELKKEKKD